MSDVIHSPDVLTIYFAADASLLPDQLMALLADRGYRIQVLHTAKQVLRVLQSNSLGIAVVQFTLPDMNAAALIKRLHQADIFLPVMVFGEPRIDYAVAAMKAGAVDYIELPLAAHALLRELEHYL